MQSIALLYDTKSCTPMASDRYMRSTRWCRHARKQCMVGARFACLDFQVAMCGVCSISAIAVLVPGMLDGMR